MKASPVRPAAAISRLLHLNRFLRPVFRGIRCSLIKVPRVLDAVLVLPRLADALDEVVTNTGRLVHILADLHRVARNTDHLTAIAATLTASSTTRSSSRGLTPSSS